MLGSDHHWEDVQAERYQQSLFTQRASCALGVVTKSRVPNGGAISWDDQPKIRTAVRDNQVHFMEMLGCVVLQGQVLPSGTFTVFAIKDQPYTDGRYVVNFESFQKSDVTVATSESRRSKHPINVMLHEFFERQMGIETYRERTITIQSFWYSNATGERELLLGHGFLLELSEDFMGFGRVFKCVDAA